MHGMHHPCMVGAVAASATCLKGSSCLVCAPAFVVNAGYLHMNLEGCGQSVLSIVKLIIKISLFCLNFV